MDDNVSVNVVPLLWVDNIENSLQFYNRLGFRVVETWRPNGCLTWCSIKLADAELMLQQRDDSESDKDQVRSHDEVELYFVCNDVDSLYRFFSTQGLQASTPKQAFYPMKQVFLRDPDGRTICFETPVET
ncbi:MAG: VOC family protein [Gammaproteobacteria bacterium]|nr:VOC family protein [Gammaproteobacteria bacterium]